MPVAPPIATPGGLNVPPELAAQLAGRPPVGPLPIPSAPPPANVGQYIQSLTANPAGGGAAAQAGLPPGAILRDSVNASPPPPVQGGIPGFQSLGALAQPLVPPPAATPRDPSLNRTPVPEIGAGNRAPVAPPTPAPAPAPGGVNVQAIPGAFTGFPPPEGQPPTYNTFTGQPLNNFQPGAAGSDFVDPVTGQRFVVNADGSVAPVIGGTYFPGYEGG